MKLPKSVQIAGQKWRIVVKPGSGDDDADHGETDTFTHTITLYTALHEKYGMPLKSTLFHELMHAALAATGANNICRGEAGEETIVCALEAALWPLIESGLLK